MVVNLVKESIGEGSSIPKLRLKLHGGPSSGEVFYFTGKETKITMGRMEDCEVHIEDALISKLQTTITPNANG